ILQIEAESYTFLSQACCGAFGGIAIFEAGVDVERHLRAFLSFVVLVCDKRIMSCRNQIITEKLP
ncbi:MAG: hypothetical protein J6S18_01370, partial [Oscillospiraceae bacterium]|nr:hypothetical protein [Oscillospiraceae bacterium]